VVARFILLLVLFLVIARTFWRFFDGIVRGASGAAPRGGRSPGSPAAVKMSQCPVCGTYVVPGKAVSVASGGSTIYFDSDKCRAEYQSR
jgi:hypothetical protein